MKASNYTRSRPTAVNPRGRQLVIAVVAVIVVVLALRLFLHHENRYEKLARGLTIALQNNDLAGVEKYQNAETATTINRGVVGRIADRLAPLGKLKSVKETTPKDASDRTHEFDVVFEKGTVHEAMKLDPDDKMVHFRYDLVPQ